MYSYCYFYVYILSYCLYYHIHFISIDILFHILKAIFNIFLRHWVYWYSFQISSFFIVCAKFYVTLVNNFLLFIFYRTTTSVSIGGSYQPIRAGGGGDLPCPRRTRIPATARSGRHPRRHRGKIPTRSRSAGSGPEVGGHCSLFLTLVILLQLCYNMLHMYFYIWYIFPTYWIQYVICICIFGIFLLHTCCNISYTYIYLFNKYINTYIHIVPNM